RKLNWARQGGIRAYHPLVVETLRKINRVTNTYRPACHLVGPNLKIGQRGAAEDCRERSIHRVLPAGDFDPADARYVEAGIGRKPGSADVDLGVGVEIHVVVRVRKSDI